jgi:hypothetical protein
MSDASGVRQMFLLPVSLTIDCRSRLCGNRSVRTNFHLRCCCRDHKENLFDLGILTSTR